MANKMVAFHNKGHYVIFETAKTNDKLTPSLQRIYLSNKVNKLQFSQKFEKFICINLCIKLLPNIYLYIKYEV